MVQKRLNIRLESGKSRLGRDVKGFGGNGGRDWTRTSDPYRVKGGIGPRKTWGFVKNPIFRAYF